MTRAAALTLTLALAACTISDQYLVERSALHARPPILDARRAKNHKPVRLYASAIRPETLTPVDDTTVRLTAAAKSRLLPAAHVLTWVGSAMSIAGGILFFASQDGTDAKLAGWILSPAAEPVMITGTILWILALKRPPQEAR
jgi:hypothetical protein